MKIKNNKNWKIYYKLFFGLLISLTNILSWLIKIIYGFKLLPSYPKNWTPEGIINFENDNGDFTFNYFSFFTVQSNILVWLWFFLSSFSLPWKKNKNKKNELWKSYNLALAITVYITITFLIYNLMLLPTKQPKNINEWIINIIEHIICPLSMIIYFIFFLENDKKNIKSNKIYWKKELWKLYFYPIIWAILMMIRGEFRYRAKKIFTYQYFFLNIHNDFAGIKGWVWFLLIIIIISILIFLLSTLFNTISYKKNNNNNNKLKIK